MYLDYYKLTAKPFQISTDPKFLWLGEKHKEALAVLKYGILDNKGFLLLTGDVGTGKTTLLNALIDSLGENVLVAMVTDPGLAKMDFFNFVADSFEMHKNFKSKGEFLIYLKNFLLDIHRQNKQALLIIDECQHLTQKLLEEVRLLSNIEKYNKKLINIFFVGQIEFNDIILKPRNRAIRQRITINYNISPLSELETEKYIRFRLQIAGSIDPVFTPQAIRAVYRFSNGYPRLINIICDQAMLTGYVKEKRTIDEKIVAECAAELRIPVGRAAVQSRATPETITPPPTENATETVPPPPPSHPRPSLKNRLVIALIIVLVIWSGLVAAYFLIQRQSAMVGGTDQGISSPPPHDGNPPPVSERVRQSTDVTPAANVYTAAVQKQPPSTIDATSGSAAVAPPAASDAPLSDGPALAPRPTLPAETNTSSSDAGVDREDPTVKKITLSAIKALYGVHPTVYFDFNANTLNRESYPVLQKIADYCLQNPKIGLVLRGYSDSSGIRAYNIKLSEFRADMVKAYLVGRGVEASAIQTIAMGPEVTPGSASASEKAENKRKVVIEIVGPDM